MNKVINSHLNNKAKSINAITLLAFLLAFFLHSQHIASDNIEHGSVADYQNCHICQQGIDSPPESIQLIESTGNYFLLHTPYFFEYVNSISSYALPQLRAPPFFSNFIY